jgi:hypothetical protein
VFPDGSTAELVYPPDLDLASLGVRPYWAACQRDFGFYYFDPYGSLYEGEPLASWSGSDGQTVSIWRSVDDEPGLDGEPIVRMIFHFGQWTVDVYDYGGSAALSDDDRAACATGLSGTVTEDGWIVMSATRDILLGGDEPELQFGDGPFNRRVPFVLFFPGPCQAESNANDRVIEGVSVSVSDGFASWCHPGEMMRIHVYFSGEPIFVEELIRQLEVREVELAR